MSNSKQSWGRYPWGDDDLRALVNGHVFLIMGPSGSGKTTIAKDLRDRLGFKMLDSYTTRPPRHEGEQGHIFVSNKEFDTLCDLVGYTVYDRYRYGATATQIENNDIYVIDPDGYKFFKAHYKGCKDARVIGIWTGEEQRKVRMQQRGDRQPDILRRLRGDMALKELESLCDIVVVNDVYTDAIRAVLQYIFLKNLQDQGFLSKKHI